MTASEKKLCSKHSARTKKIALGLLVLLCAIAFYLGGRIFLAALATYQAESFLEDWVQKVQKGQLPSERAWSVAAQAAQRALALYPIDNGDYYDRLGRILEWKTIGLPFGDAAAETGRLQALDAYRASVAARPLWPYTWVRIVAVKTQLLQFDEEFDRALKQAFALGPWRIESNAGLAHYGLLGWPRLTTEQRDLVLETVRRAVADSEFRTNGIMAHAERLKLTETVCSAIAEELRRRRSICLE